MRKSKFPRAAITDGFDEIASKLTVEQFEIILNFLLRRFNLHSFFGAYFDVII